MFHVKHMTEVPKFDKEMQMEKKLTAGLYLVPSPLGNLSDLTLRAIEVLTGADIVLAEDTRRSLKLLNHLGLRKSLLSYREQNHQRMWPKVAEMLADGAAIALLTDAGCPSVSDPGAELARAAGEAGFAVWPLPGPSAVTCALAASGFSADRFFFAGFLPSASKERRKFIEGLVPFPWTLVFFEAPHRLADSLADLTVALGPRPCFLAREMTKLHEEYLATDLAALTEDVEKNPRQGEITLVVGGNESPPTIEPLDEAEICAIARQDNRPTKALAAELAASTGHSRSKIYGLIVAARQEGEKR